MPGQFAQLDINASSTYAFRKAHYVHITVACN